MLNKRIIITIYCFNIYDVYSYIIKMFNTSLTIIIIGCLLTTNRFIKTCIEIIKKSVTSCSR